VKYSVVFTAHAYVTFREVYQAASHGQSALGCFSRLFPRYRSHLLFYATRWFFKRDMVFPPVCHFFHICKVLGGVYASNTSGITAQHLEWVSCFTDLFFHLWRWSIPVFRVLIDMVWPYFPIVGTSNNTENSSGTGLLALPASLCMNI
jgi:hypothetical protein